MKLRVYLRCLAFFSLAVFAGSGCVTSHLVEGTARAPISPSEVQVFTRPPAVPYERIATISTDSGWSFTPGAQSKVDKVLKRLKADAAKLGANGIVVYGIGNFTSAVVANGTGTLGVPLTEKRGSAIAIYIPHEANTGGSPR